MQEGHCGGWSLGLAADCPVICLMNSSTFATLISGGLSVADALLLGRVLPIVTGPAHREVSEVLQTLFTTCATKVPCLTD